MNMSILRVSATRAIAMTDGMIGMTPNTLPQGYRIGQMTRAEASILDSWAAQEGWNPGLSDIDIAWAFDPDAFIALRARR